MDAAESKKRGANHLFGCDQYHSSRLRKSADDRKAQQCAVFPVFPIIALIIGQFTGVIMVSAWIHLALGLVLTLLAAILLKGSVRKFTYELLLK